MKAIAIIYDFKIQTQKNENIAAIKNHYQAFANKTIHKWCFPCPKDVPGATYSNLLEILFTVHNTIGKYKLIIMQYFCPSLCIFVH
jgi:predicted aldo/keto reductase-like oxidoreductase